MQVEQLLELLTQHNIKVGLEGEQLKIRAAKGALTSEIKQALSAHKAALIDWLRLQQQQQEQRTAIAVRSAPELPCALSFAQQRLHFIQQLEPGSVSYNIPAAVKIHGDLNPDALQQALRLIIERHDSLRTGFIEQDDIVQQIVLDAIDFDLTVEDFRTKEPQAVEQAIAATACQRFDLQKAPLLAARLLHTASDEYVLVLCLHHIITDGWSTGILLQELIALYQAVHEGAPNPLPPLSIQYPDFAVWQRERLSGDQLKQQIDYWQRQLAGVEPLPLLTDFARPAMKGQQGANVNSRFSAELSQRLQAFAKQQGVTLFSVLMAGFKLLLQRYSQVEDICVGTPVANRNRLELEPLIGFFVNTLALRSQVSASASFAEQVQIEQELMLAASRYQDAPFEQVIEALDLPRNPSHTPVFQHMLVLQNSPAEQIEVSGLSFEQLSADTHTAKFDLTFNVLEVAAGSAEAYLDLNIEYDTQLFKPERIEKLAQHFMQLLDHAEREADSPLKTLKMLSDDEQQQLLDWGQPRSDYPREKNLAELFAETAARYPDNIAVVFGSQKLTYQQLEQQSNQLAAYLKQQGVKAEDKIALCFDRSLWCVLSILAVIKNHAAYVPLDPDYPDERLAFMLEDTQARLLLSESSFAERLQALPCLQNEVVSLLLLDQQAEQLQQQAIDWKPEPAPCDSGRQLAYIMYTSGSTGAPKGVMVAQRGIVRLVRQSNYIALDETDALAFISNVSFDAATFEIWGALLNGGRLVGVDKETLLTPPLFKQVLIAEQISAMFITVTLFNQYIAEDVHFFDSVKSVSVGGEALDINKIRTVIDSARQANAPLRLFNGYGPTENTTFTCSWHIDGLDAQQNSVPLGYPLANSSVYVLDEQMQLVPAGVAGELYTGGDGVALAYLNRADLTAAAFLADPFSSQPDARLYRTGDRVRWLDNGQIEMLGRADDQVKIRGYRIELGEIETALGRLPQVRECAVLVNTQQAEAELHGQGSQSDRQYLAAYLVLNEADNEFALGLIREALSIHLPQYMQPQAYVVVDKLPLTANGKLDKRGLPKPQATDFVQQQYTAPETETEKQLVVLWQQMLDLEQIGIDDNFFELGGHSLMATRLLSQIKQTFDAELPLKELFEQPTIRHLASLLDGEAQQSLQIPVLDAAAYPQGYPLSYAQQRLWIIDQLQPGSPMYNIPLAMRVSGSLDKERLQQAFKALIERHASLRTRFVDCDEGDEQSVRQQIIARPDWQLACFRLAYDEELLKQRVAAFMLAGFDLQNGPLLRAQLIELEDRPDEAILLLCQHHIISDGWSLQVLLQELLALYEGQSLAAAELQYHDFAVWQRQWLEQGVMQQELVYWQQQLSNAATLELPTDTPRPHLPSAQGLQYRFNLDAGLSQALSAFSQQQGCTLYMTLLAAWQFLLACYSQQDDISVGTPVANRTQAQTESLIGFFVNTLVMRSRINDQNSFVQLLAQVKQTCLAAYSHQHVPFEHLVDQLQVQRELSQTPLFQTMFMLQNFAEAGQGFEHFEQGDLHFSDLSFEGGQTAKHMPCAAKFDVSLALSQTPQGLQGILDYRSPLFSEQRMEALLADYEFLLRQVLAHPRQALNDLDLLRPEQQTLLQHWNDTAADYPQLCVQTLIENQAAKTPAAIACRDKEGELSYTELNQQSNQLAAYLREQGVAANVNVGICLAGACQALVAVLAVIKAGGAYVPMDVSYPAERLQHMANNAEMLLVISEAKHQHLLQAQSPLDVLDIAQVDLWQSFPRDNLPLQNTLADRLYMIFTSGSTGLPKAAAVSHANEVNLLHWYCAEHGFNADDKTLIISALGFDLTQKNLLALLTVGGCVVFSAADNYEPELISRQIAQQQITVLNCAPSAFYPLLEQEANWCQLDSLRHVLFGGEPIQLPLLKPWLQQSSCQLINMYGPTECCDIAASYRCRDEDLERLSLPIGRPNANVQLYVLSPDSLRRLPIGAAGELCIAGDGVGLGYFNQPQLNQQAFVDNPFGEGRLYRSGDLVRYRFDGQLEFISRIDGQVKVRGFRIELAEIEAQLQQCAGLKEAAVAAKTLANGQAILAAFVLLEAGAELNAAHYRQQLKQSLPDYMVPAAYVAVEAIPLTPNGKLDRNSLQLPADADFGQRDYVAPEGETQEGLATIWQEVLGREQIGAHDDFFESGGHSLLATRLVSRLQQHFEVELNLSHIFEYPQLCDLANYIDTLLWAQAAQAGAENSEGHDEDSDDDREEFEF